jgi:hypothetical protein
MYFWGGTILGARWPNREIARVVNRVAGCAGVDLGSLEFWMRNWARMMSAQKKLYRERTFFFSSPSKSRAEIDGQMRVGKESCQSFHLMPKPLTLVGLIKGNVRRRSGLL